MAEGVLEITTENFEESVLKTDKPAVVDFWAPWCGPCKALGPTIAELADEYEGRAVIGKLNVDEARDVAVQYGITSIPAVLVFKNGEMVENLVGAQPKSRYSAAIDGNL
ncbi:MAG: thioredoxin [Planctomycetota bacterium]|jgi:thioredoxin 1|nr:thioredoxin [Planctomycetota bacterium]MDP7130271.1 thioredoxin [Planctomycetota bacterium]MDP7251939.1 thioredoxin [Planctomycetota bacterium]